MSAVHTAKSAVRRVIKRAADLSERIELVEVVQTRGPRLEFNGELIAEKRFDVRTRDDMELEFEVWRTTAGALVAVKTSLHESGFEGVSAHVVPYRDNEQEMQDEVMGFFDWSSEARDMMKRAKWTFRRWVD